MSLNIALVLARAVVGFLVGLTGMGGGALMTPMLVLIFGVTPSAAISSDLIAALFMKPLGVAVHWHKKTIQPLLVWYLCYGSVPAAILGTYVLHLLGRRRFLDHRGLVAHPRSVNSVHAGVWSFYTHRHQFRVPNFLLDANVHWRVG